MTTLADPRLAAAPFAGRTGRGVRVAVIDSGVNPAHPHIGRVAGGGGVRTGGVIERGDFLGKLGHGMAVMAAIQEKAPAADYFSVQLFHNGLRTNIDLLLRALDWAVDEGMDVVVGVGLDLRCARDLYRVERTENRDVFYASGYPRPIPGLPPERNLRGVSFAVANMTGFVVRACESVRSAKEEISSSTLHRALVSSGSRGRGQRRSLRAPGDLAPEKTF